MRLDDLKIGAATIYGEARGSTQQDRIAVAHVLLNRAKAKSWFGRGVDGYEDNSVAAVCRKPWQFSCWNAGNPNRPKLDAIVADFEASVAEIKPFRACVKAFVDAYDGHEKDPTDGATHYLTRTLYRSDECPDWARGKPYIAIGEHHYLPSV